MRIFVVPSLRKWRQDGRHIIDTLVIDTNVLPCQLLHASVPKLSDNPVPGHLVHASLDGRALVAFTLHLREAATIRAA